MALAFAAVGRSGGDVVGSQRRTVTDITMDSSYQSGGEPVTANNLRLGRVVYATAQIQSTSGGGVNVSSAGYDPATALLHVYDETPAEVASTADISTTVIRVEAYGTG
jgi:hypothetical protein